MKVLLFLLRRVPAIIAIEFATARFLGTLFCVVSRTGDMTLTLYLSVSSLMYSTHASIRLLRFD